MSEKQVVLTEIEKLFLSALQDPETRAKIILILKEP